MLHGELTEQIIGGFYKVYNELGYGFLEKVYENSLSIELQKQSLEVKQQHPISVQYNGLVVGEYYADLLINDMIIIELKAAKNINSAHESQLVNYLKATKKEVGLILNFGPKPEFKRRILSK